MRSMVFGIVSALLIGTASVHAAVPLPYPENNWPQLAKLLADKTISPDWRTPDGRSIVLLQLQYGSEEEAVDLLKRASRRKVWIEGRGERLLTIAVTIGSQQIVQTLLSRSENPNAITDGEDPPLMMAAHLGRLEIMRMLIRAGADINYAHPKISVGPIHSAIQGGRYMAVNILIDSGVDLAKYKAHENEHSLIFSAIDGQSLETMQILIDKKFDLNGRRHNGDTPLTYAVSVAAPRNVVEQLLMNGADPCVENSNGELPEELVYIKDDLSERREQNLKGLFSGGCKKKDD